MIATLIVAKSGAANDDAWRSADPQFGAAIIGGATHWVDAGAPSRPGIDYDLVRAVDSCRWEGP